MASDAVVCPFCNGTLPVNGNARGMAGDVALQQHMQNSHAPPMGSGAYSTIPTRYKMTPDGGGA